MIGEGEEKKKTKIKLLGISLTGYSTWGYKRVRHDLPTKQQK